MELATEWVEILNQKCNNSNAYRYDLDVVAALDPRDMFALKSRRYTTPGKVILNAGRLCFPTVQKRRLSLNSSSTDVDNMNLMIGNNMIIIIILWTLAIVIVIITIIIGKK